MFLKPKAAHGAFALALGVLSAPVSVFAQAQGGAAPQGGMGQTLSFFMPLVLVFGIFYFLIIRPQQKQAKKQQEMLKAIEKGNHVVTLGGLHGKVVGTTESVLTLEIADNVKVKIERASIQSVKNSGKGE